jgi:hypothetical protein
MPAGRLQWRGFVKAACTLSNTSFTVGLVVARRHVGHLLFSRVYWSTACRAVRVDKVICFIPRQDASK